LENCDKFKLVHEYVLFHFLPLERGRVTGEGEGEKVRVREGKGAGEEGRGKGDRKGEEGK
jgi:hypothetical protein